MAARFLTLLQSRSPLASAAEQLRLLGRVPIARGFDEALSPGGLDPLTSQGIDVLQINVGKLCNQTCRHCHVDAGPDRREVMSRETMALCLRALDASSIPIVDITGGAPELNPDFRWLVRECAARGKHVIDRCNLTVLLTPSHADLPQFFAEHRVELVCSLPHYRAPSTDAQRGAGVFEKSLEALRRLNAIGYGNGTSGLRLVLVTNPVGAFLPGGQASLEAEWKREMLRRYGIAFDALFCLTNMPISRYLDWLIETGNLEGYMERLVNAFNPAAARGVMCRTMVSVGWDGRLFDCDFNQMLELEVSERQAAHIRDFDPSLLAGREIVVGPHCFGCTAGAGSSCGGATL
ncbi:MAG: arsenosugar biosynthesis radical SAM protein ArsS [Acidobacteria bacterium]|nr:arsenosugar biosynthesis radical SAM protein ArsS [Acidobacteriota bacterium]